MAGGGLLLDPSDDRVDPATSLGRHSNLVAVAGESQRRWWESARWCVLARPVRDILLENPDSGACGRLSIFF